MTVSIIPIVDHEAYSVNGHIVKKNSSEMYHCSSPMFDAEWKAFKRYEKLVINNPRFKKHTKATYKD